MGHGRFGVAAGVDYLVLISRSFLGEVLPRSRPGREQQSIDLEVYPTVNLSQMLYEIHSGQQLRNVVCQYLPFGALVIAHRKLLSLDKLSSGP